MDEGAPPDKYPDSLGRIFPAAAAVNRAFYAAARAELPPLLTFTTGKRYVLPPPGMTAMEVPEGPDSSISATLKNFFLSSPQDLKKIRRFAIRRAKYTVRNDSSKTDQKFTSSR